MLRVRRQRARAVLVLVTQDTFPRQNARTRRFTLGRPRSFRISPNGGTILFCRSRTGSDPVAMLWRLDVDSGREELLVDPTNLIGEGPGELPPEEQARRERARETSEGIVRFTTDRELTRAVFNLAGRLFLADLRSGGAHELPVQQPAVDPRLDPSGRHVAYVNSGSLRVIGADGSGDCGLAAPEGPDVAYGLPEFVAAEEMSRDAGFWWSPDGEQLLVARVDESAVRRIYLTDPAHPERSPREMAYPDTGSANAEVTLALIGIDGTRTDVAWDYRLFEYLAAVSWSAEGLLALVQQRDQRRSLVLEIDPGSGAATVVREDTDPEWLEITGGVPARAENGALVFVADSADTSRIEVDGEPVTPPGLQVRSVIDVSGQTVLFTASAEPTEVGVWEWSPEGGVVEICCSAGDLDPAVRKAVTSGGTTVVSEARLDRHGTSFAVWRRGEVVRRIETLEETPLLTPTPKMLRLGPAKLRAALLLPSWHVPGSGRLPVLLDPYGGPGAQRVLSAQAAFLTSQWFAEQGFAVLVADGRGTPGRGRAWTRAIHGDFATPVLDDQVTALEEAAKEFPDLDVGRVAIRGWSFGGYLAALAVLRRPDVFHAAVAGAPVTDFRLYDTHYTERYLGTPADDPGNYDRVSLFGDAAGLTRPLMLIHGLADDNVVVANTLQFSAMLTAAGRPHTVLPLSGVTHMTPQEEVAENLLLLEIDFLRRALSLEGS
jgi:dipeptidyl-peptidase-4